MVERMLALADQLIDVGARSSALKRRAVSTAYYATFHSIARSCADELIGGDRADEAYVRVYRALEHNVLKNAFKASPLKDIPALARIGENIVRLRSEREKADYLPPRKNLFTAAQAQELVELARRAIAEIEQLQQQERRTLATILLFKNRPE